MAKEKSQHSYDISFSIVRKSERALEKFLKENEQVIKMIMEDENFIEARILMINLYRKTMREVREHIEHQEWYIHDLEEEIEAAQS